MACCDSGGTYKIRYFAEVNGMKFISLLVALTLLLSSSIASAERIKGKGASELYRSIGYDSQGNTTVKCDNGLVVQFTSLYVCNGDAEGYDLENTGSNVYWFKYGLLGLQYALGVQGVYLDLTNTTNKLMIVKWSESSLNLGSFSGIPFLSGMKYKDAGKPHATPDTFIPPNKTVTVILYSSNVSFSNGEWYQGYEFVRVDKSLKANVYMKVLDQNGVFTYCAAESPAIIVPQSSLDALKN